MIAATTPRFRRSAATRRPGQAPGFGNVAATPKPPATAPDTTPTTVKTNPPRTAKLQTVPAPAHGSPRPTVVSLDRTPTGPTPVTVSPPRIQKPNRSVWPASTPPTTSGQPTWAGRRT